MVRSLYSIFDKVAGESIGPVMSLCNDAHARRVFQDALTGEGSQLASHPGDYSLHVLGTFDTETGQISVDYTRAEGGPFEGLPIVTGEEVMRKLAERQQARPQMLDHEFGQLADEVRQAS